MTIEEICDSEGVTLAYFDNDLWQRPGMIISDMRIIFVNKSLSGDAQKRVILHELGHLKHTKGEYTINPIKCENEANRAMIHELLREELEQVDKEDFNYLNFMERHKLKTTTDELMVIDEFYRLVG
ncbi:ImmA/IrrE family metallo-endopeptidase [Streptococcus parasanguinis]|uniref:ImmA/IrrE family metallo-endopeptidase n=1 Tax=Streptococcus parasanguinis TaxID=1318 RepID=UPI0012BC8E75|nr:ImmA/IrrE family metallo-endopeptidase [Streptococcus parasanguinis]MTR54179.1 ImmA/IrrE family metallo-endopeptidase [Streptococcus parasanguinis]MTR56119.1 ImmA/IrrE family metallo-endopeptidase [Streptococcus parasanguinis]MTR60751.1 ImmA/IrrE family metallo-endopeptidase [Streptococcus parasanguinis]MTR69998.1 ImmA/IrrE family metallo-endopeptidase [Streptococcus parasanguinis]MTS02480.1 ImmA/IrrE family metallo-endopeptidase [Streptococcus parasanguinis]